MATVIYDGGCGICQRFRRLVSVFDRGGRLTWVDLHQADFSDHPVTESDAIAAMQVIDDGVYAGYDAVRRVCRLLPLLWPVYLFLSIPGIPVIGRRVYRYVARHRHCTIPRDS